MHGKIQRNVLRLMGQCFCFIISGILSCGGGASGVGVDDNGWKLPPTGSVNRKYPKLVNYYHYSPNETPADMRSERLAQWDMVIVFPYKAISENLSFSRMRQLNPNIKILAWIPIGQSPDRSFPFGAGIPAAGSSDWFLREINGGYVTFGAPYYEHIMNPYRQNYAWPKYIVNFAKTNYLDNNLYDGVFLDCMTEYPLLCGSFDTDVNEDGVFDASDILSWKDGISYAVKELKTQCPGKLVTGNGGNPLSSSCVYYQWVDGAYHENALGDEFGSTNWSGESNSIWDGYLESMTAGARRHMIGVDVRNGESRSFDVAKSKTKLSGDDLRRMRLGLCTTLLGDGYFGFDSGDCIHGQLWWFDEYDVDLGNPVSGYTQSSGLYTRIFENGEVYVNPTGHDAIIVAGAVCKDATTKEINNRFIIPSRDGRILTKSFGGIAQGNLILNGSFNYGSIGWGIWANNGSAGSMVVENGQMKATITSPGTNIYDIGITELSVPIENGHTYTARFKARAATPCQIAGILQLQGNPWTIYSHNDVFTIGTTMKEYSFTFTMNDPTDAQSSFVFQFGGNGPNTIYFDNVSLVRTN